MKLLHKYLNGNVTVSLYEEGTKIIEWEDGSIPMPIYPTSMDVKITNKCDLGCSFCHENSVPNGVHGNLLAFLKLVKELPAGTELALGGGNPLEHPDLAEFLSECQQIGIIVNMTVNQEHFKRNIDYLNLLIKSKRIHGLGISISESFDFSLLEHIENYSNIVFHVIAGIQNISILDKIKESPVKKVLILGYKTVGRGVEFYDGNVIHNLTEWILKLKTYIGKLTLAFDNLGLVQLNLKELVSQEVWDKHYMGGDGKFTMYVDLVKNQFAISSTSYIRYPMLKSIMKMFEIVKVVSTIDDKCRDI